MGSKHSMAGWFAIAAIAAIVAGGVAFARSASESMRLPRGDIEPLAVSPEAYRYATLREAASQWAHELDRAVAGLQEQAVVDGPTRGRPERSWRVRAPSASSAAG